MSLPSLTPLANPVGVYNPDGGAWQTIINRIFSLAILPVLAWVAGVVTVGIIIYGGYQYMSAQGDTKKAGEARKTILGGIIGIAIIVAAYSIVTVAVSVGNTLSK